MSKNGYVYALQHNKTKRMYIGQARDVGSRYIQHISKLRNKKHGSKNMQADYDQYGEDYSVFILEEGTTSRVNHPYGYDTVRDLTAKEFSWMRKYKTTEAGGYNEQDIAAKKYIKKMNKFECYGFPLKDGLPSID